MPKYASVTAQRAELLALYREGAIDSAILRESLASLARETAPEVLVQAPPAPTVVVVKQASKSAKKNAKKRKKKLAAQAQTREVAAPELAVEPEPEPEQTLTDDDLAQAQILGLVDEPPHAREEENGADFYHAEFHLDLYEDKNKDGNLRLAGFRIMRGWAHLTNNLIQTIRGL